MPIPARRSVVLLPAHKWRQIPQVVEWRPDSVCLDLADLLSLAQRAAAREGMREALASVGRRGAEALVRLSTDERQADLRAVVWPGLSALVVTGLRGVEDVEQLENALAVLEEERGLDRGRVGLVAYLDHGQGLWYAREIAQASSRIQALALGMGDLAFEMLKEPESVPFFTGPVPRFPVPEYIWGRLSLVAADAGVVLFGLLGTTIGPGRAQKVNLLSAAQMARQAGFGGAFVLHWEGVEACNEVFPAPAPAARRRATS